MDKNIIVIAVRPKTNSSYTAKKATVLSKLDLHFIDYVPHVGPDDNLSEWKVVTRQDLQDIEDGVYKQILKELECAPNAQLLKDTCQYLVSCIYLIGDFHTRICKRNHSVLVE